MAKTKLPNHTSCVTSGSSLGRLMGTTMYRENVIAANDELTAPHSELAMHSGVAGKDIVAWACNKNECGIVVANGKKCRTVFGLLSEALSSKIRRQTLSLPKGA